MKLSQAGGRLVVTVVEAPVINRVAFEGNKRVKDDQLTAEVQSKPRGTLSRPMVQSDVQRIADVYHHSGRFDVRVEPKIIELPNNRVDLVFEITEGEKTAVREIVFVGNRTFGKSRLKDVIKTSESGILSFLKSADIYDADRVEALYGRAGEQEQLSRINHLFLTGLAGLLGITTAITWDTDYPIPEGNAGEWLDLAEVG